MEDVHIAPRRTKNWSNFTESVDYAVDLPKGYPRVGMSLPGLHGEERAWNIIEIQPGKMEGNTLKHSRLQIITSKPIKTVQKISAEVPKNDQQLTEEMVQQTLEEPEFSLLVPWLKEGKEPDEKTIFLSSPEAKHRGEFSLKKGVLWRQIPEMGRKLVVPKGLRTHLLEGYHNIPSGGHQGVDRTRAKIQEKYYWYKMARQIKDYVNSCAICNQNKKPNRKACGALINYHAGSPMERMHLDFLGPLPKTIRGNEYILMMVDKFTKCVEGVPLPSQTAEETARAAENEFFSRFGCPFIIHTDQGRNFESQLFQAICKLLGIHKTRTTAYRPSANGQVERYNRTLMDAVRCYVKKDINWDEHLAQITGAMRASVNRQTGYTPNRLMLGGEVNLPGDLMFPNVLDNREKLSVDKYVVDLTASLETAHVKARQNLAANQKRMRKDYDLRKLVHDYKVGDAVFVLDSSGGKGKCKKLLPPWKGPGIILEKLSPSLFRVKTGRMSSVVNHDRIKECRNRELPHWILRLQHNPEALKEALKDAKRDKEALYCLCRKPDDGQLMIQCDECSEWFHGACMGISKKMADKLKSYLCPSCEAGPFPNRFSSN